MQWLECMSWKQIIYDIKKNTNQKSMKWNGFDGFEAG